jgi:polyphosphate kinase
VREKILAIYLSDTAKGRLMKSDGTYARRAAPGGKKAVSTQDWLLRQITQKTGSQKSEDRRQKSE